MRPDRKIDKILKKVEKPARYIGMEQNAIVKDFEKCSVRFAFAFPDVYEVGMSHLGLQILYYLINGEDDFLCERVFAPWTDMEDLMREENVLLYSLESKRPIKDFDILGFTLQYEMSYTNILNMMDLSGIPPYSKDRGEDCPLIFAGGPCAYNPEPLAPFVDVFLIGEGEELNLEVLREYKKAKLENSSKSEILMRLSQIEGVYVPAFYEEIYNADGTLRCRNKKAEFAPDIIKKRRVSELDSMFSPEKFIVPYIETVHDRVVLEMFRGCTKGCRFCQAGIIYRPVREKSVGKLIELSEKFLSSTGYREVSLSSLSSCDYTQLENLIKKLMEDYEKSSIAVSLPSLRIDSFSMNVMKEIEKVRKTGITLAPEAGSQRMRDVINKGVTEEQLISAVKQAFDYGWSKIKLYFMIGLPTETEQDIIGIKNLAYSVKDVFFKRPKEDIVGNFQVTASVSCFVPKAFTPFQWLPQDSVQEFYRKIEILKDSIKDPKVKLNYHEPETSFIEAVIARGDRRVAAAIYTAWEKGQRFDAWSEYFSFETWIESFEQSGIKPEFYANRRRSSEELFPWDFIDAGVSKKFLEKELEKSMRGELTLDCRKRCNACGMENCEMREVFHEIKG